MVGPIRRAPCPSDPDVMTFQNFAVYFWYMIDVNLSKVH